MTSARPLARSCKDKRQPWQRFWRKAVSSACESGQLEVLRYLLSTCSVSLADLCPYDEPFSDPNAGIEPGQLIGQPLYEPVPNPAPPLWIAAQSGPGLAIARSSAISFSRVLIRISQLMMARRRSLSRA